MPNFASDFKHLLLRDLDADKMRLLCNRLIMRSVCFVGPSGYAEASRPRGKPRGYRLYMRLIISELSCVAVRRFANLRMNLQNLREICLRVGAFIGAIVLFLS